MGTEFHIRQDCRLCAGGLSKVLELPDTPLANEYPAERGKQDHFPLFVARCDDCGHVQLPVVVNPERLFREYAYQSGTSPVFREHLREFVRCTLPLQPDALVVDIASNDGSLLNEYAQRGHPRGRLLGIDPARNLAERALERGIETWSKFFNAQTAQEVVARYGQAHLATALNVFAHVDDPDSFVANVKTLLRDGLAVFEFSYLPDMIERGGYAKIYHEHLAYFHLRPLVDIFAKHGLEMFDAHRVNTQGGSVRAYVRHSRLRGAGECQSERLAALLAAETPAALNAGRLATRIHEDRVLLQACLADLRAQGKTVCGYGAPAQLTTLCYALGITAQDIDFIVDDNPLKVGRYTPGINIPIVLASELYVRKPDACVIFSANFADDIRRRHADYQGEWVQL